MAEELPKTEPSVTSRPDFKLSAKYKPQHVETKEEKRMKGIMERETRPEVRKVLIGVRKVWYV